MTLDVANASAPAQVIDERHLFRRVLDVITHDLGSIAGGLMMRGEALRLGAPGASAAPAMESAGRQLSRAMDGLRFLHRLPGVGDPGSPPAIATEPWRRAVADLLPGLLGAERQLTVAGDAGARHLEGAVAAALACSVLAQGLAWRLPAASYTGESGGRRSAASATTDGAPIRLRFGVASEGTFVVVTLGMAPPAESRLAHETELPVSEPWVRLSDELAARGGVTVDRHEHIARWSAPSHPAPDGESQGYHDKHNLPLSGNSVPRREGPA